MTKLFYSGVIQRTPQSIFWARADSLGYHPWVLYGETMAEKVVIGNAELYLGDCLDVLPTLPKVDAVITDPPYGIGIDRSMAASSGHQSGGMSAPKGEYVASGWDDAPISAEHIAMLMAAGTQIVIFGGNYFQLPPSKCWLVWDKKVNGHFADCELAWTNLDKPVRRIEWMWNGMLRQGGESRNGHPTQKPLAVMQWCLGHTDGRSVLDPFMGSGTTGVAAALAGRFFIGIEREPKYFDIAVRRITEAQKQQELFRHEDVQAMRNEQIGLGI